MNKPIIYGLIAILFLSTAATAQFKLKIPKIKKKKIPKVGKDIGKSVGATNSKNRQMVIDDGFTFFEATPVKVHSAKHRGYIAKGWTLTGRLRAFGTFPDQSGFKMIVAKSGKAVATYSCVGKPHRKAESPVKRVKNSPDDDYLMTTNGCGRSNSIVVKDAGKYDVQVFVINGDDDKTTLLRTYKIDVHEAKKVRPGGVMGVSDFYIQRHAEAPVAMLYLRPRRGSGGYVKHDYHQIKKGSTLVGNVDIYFNVAMETNRMDFSNAASVRCFVNGKRLKFTNRGNIKHGAMRSDTAKYERDGKPTERLGFYNYWINLPIEWRANGTNKNPDMEQLSGDWKCQLRDGMDTIRTFQWTVKSGFPVEHIEQTSGNVNLHWGAYLIDMEIPTGGSKVDKALMPMPNAGLFYGIPFKSDEGKKQAAAVPKKGKPFLMQ